MKNKKVLWISLLSLDVAITLFLLVVSIIMLTYNKVDIATFETIGYDNFVQYLAIHPNLYLGVCVIPLFLLLFGNVAGLVVYIRKITAKKKVGLNELSEEQKEALKAELLKELNK